MKTIEKIQENIIGAGEDKDFGHSLVVHMLIYTPKKEELTECHNMFRTMCTITGKLYDVNIYCGSGENIVSSIVVQKLELKTEHHPRLYKIRWIKKDSEIMVIEIYLIKFSMENTYFDETYCDVVDIDACHMILDQP